MARPTACAVSPPAKRVTIGRSLMPPESLRLRSLRAPRDPGFRGDPRAGTQGRDDLGYEANPIARALASGRTGMVGILGPSLEDLWQQRLVAEAGRGSWPTIVTR